MVQMQNQVTDLFRDRGILSNVAQAYPAAKPVLSTTLLSCISHAPGEAPQDPHSQTPGGHQPPAAVESDGNWYLVVLLGGSGKSPFLFVHPLLCLSRPSSSTALQAEAPRSSRWEEARVRVRMARGPAG